MAATLLATTLLSCTYNGTPVAGPIMTQVIPRPERTGTSPSRGPSTLSALDLSSAVPPSASSSVRPTAVPGKTSHPPTNAPIISGVPNYLIEAPELDIYKVAAELVPGLSAGFPRVVTPSPPRFETGRIDTFWLIDSSILKVYERAFELRLITNHAYWYVEEDQSIRQQDLERSAAAFENEIYPRMTEVFGSVWSPGVDDDPHLNILNANLSGTGGYYTSGDEYPNSVFEFSNQREIIYVNTSAYTIGSPSYNRVLAHELQHAIHWNEDPSEETWVEEGLSELAATLVGYGQHTAGRFLQGTPTSLVHWPLSSEKTRAHYGAASLFMHYLYEHYVTPDGLRPLLAVPEDGISGINAYLATSGLDVTFKDVFRDWAVANLLNQSEGKYGYADLDPRISVQASVDSYSEFSSAIPQYSVEYIEFSAFSDAFHLRFQGRTETPLLPVDVGARGCWWSNSGDSIDSTLTRPLDLKGLRHATLNFQVWHSLEEMWDYAYLEVSTDGGRKWNFLETPHTSTENPVGNSFGVGYTGESEVWLQESVDLTQYSGQKILLRFQYVTDQAVNGAGLCLRQISITETGPHLIFDGWDANGFIHIDNRVPQDYIVQVIEVAEETRVRVMPLDDSNSGEVLVQAPRNLDRLVVVVAALAPKTLQPASYALSAVPTE